jgi:hypothetical protein
MTNPDKAKTIKSWIDPRERVTVHFHNARDLNAEVTGCNDVMVNLSLETDMPYMQQAVSVPLSHVRVSEDLSHYTRDPDRPLQRRRLLLDIDQDRPALIY